MSDLILTLFLLVLLVLIPLFHRRWVNSIVPHFMTLSINKDDFEIKRASFLGQEPKMQIAWTDIQDVYKSSLVGSVLDAIDKKIGLNQYERLTVKTKDGTFDFFPYSAKSFPRISRFTTRLAEGTDLSFKLEGEFIKRNIAVRKINERLHNGFF